MLFVRPLLRPLHLAAFHNLHMLNNQAEQTASVYTHDPKLLKKTGPSDGEIPGADPAGTGEHLHRTESLCPDPGAVQRTAPRCRQGAGKNGGYQAPGQGIKELFKSEKYRNYLRTMSRFHSYSTNNIMLIHMQMPHASHVAGFNKWKNQFGRHVKKGERSIKIIAPTPFKKKVEEIKRDPDTKALVLYQDGKAILEEKAIQIPMFKVVSIFDVSQTEGKPLPHHFVIRPVEVVQDFPS